MSYNHFLYAAGISISTQAFAQNSFKEPNPTLSCIVLMKPDCSGPAAVPLTMEFEGKRFVNEGLTSVIQFLTRTTAQIQLTTATPAEDYDQKCGIAPMEKTLSIGSGQIYFVRLPHYSFAGEQCDFSSKIPFKSATVTDECAVEPFVRRKLEELCYEPFSS